MGSKNPFFFSESPIVAPVICKVCGQNAHCLRRQANGAGEVQTFQCTCGNTEARVRGAEVSDAALQEQMEKRIEGGTV